MRSLLSIRVIIALSGCMFCNQVVAYQEAGEDQDAALAVAAEGYANNIDSFTHFRCLFQFAGHTADSIEDAIAGRFTGKIGHISEGLWVVKRPWERYLLTCDPDVIANAKRQMHEPPSNPGASFGTFKACITQDYLSNGQFQLTRGIFLGVAHLSQSGSHDHSHRTNIDPLRLDIRTPSLYPDSLLQKCVKKEWYGKFEGVQEERGRTVMVITCGETKNHLRSRFFLDPERGFLPIRDELLDPESGKRQVFSLITDFISCPGGRWFPRRSLTFIVNPKKGDRPPYTNIREIKVNSLELKVNLGDDDFALTIPKGYQVTMPPNRFALIGLKNDPLTVTPLSMGKLYQRLLDSEQYWKAQAASNASFKKNTRGNYRLHFWIFQGCLLVVITVIYIIYKKLRKRVSNA